MNIKIKKDGYLIFKKIKVNCVFGKNGLKINKKEGDKATPKGKFTLGKLYYRADRIKKLKTSLIKKKIKKNMGWCHNANNSKYNKEIKHQNNKNSEKLYRKDQKYDLFLVINYNINPVVKGKGSAIFLHITKNNKPTNGCVATQKENLIKLLKEIKPKTKIIIG